MTNQRRSLQEAALLTWSGTFLSILFVFDVYPPRSLAIALLASVAAWGILAVRKNKFALFQRLVILIYALPFTVTLGYLVDSDYSWAFTPARIVLMQDDLVILQMLATGLVGLIGLLAGMKLAEVVAASGPGRVSPRYLNKSGALLPFGAFMLFVIASLVFVWLGSGATSSIFEAAYSGSAGLAEFVNFNAASLLASVILILLYVDTERSSPTNGKQRYLLLLGSVTFVVLFELSRGNRDSFGLIVALLALYVTGGTAGRLQLGFLQEWRRSRRVLIPAIAIVSVFVLIGALRVALTSPELLADTRTIFRIAFLENTWTAILLSNLGLAALYSSGSMEYLLGATYVDYLLSTPPGFLTHLFDITRPIEADRGPAWWFIGITGGGVHPVIVPFRNFGIFGALSVLAAIGALVTWMDTPNKSLGRRFLFGVGIAVSFKWLWYGDMSLIRALMAALLVWLAYRIVLTIRPQAWQ